jgi:NitT/TauT family transport system ATP-binding protein
MTDGPALVRVENVSKTFTRRGRSVLALGRADLSVRHGELVCLLGPSGCGKSTLLNIIAGLVPYESGAVYVDDQLVRGPAPKRGMLFQRPMLFPWATTRQNVMFGPRAQGRMRGAASAEVRAEAEAILETVGLRGFEDAYPSELSGGMLHRAAFARSLMSKPSVLLMDEPFGALDALTRTRMQEFLLEMWALYQLTIVFVTHDIEEAILLADRVCVMGRRPSRIVEELTVPIRRPRTVDDVDLPEFVSLRRRARQLLASEDAAEVAIVVRP